MKISGDAWIVIGLLVAAVIFAMATGGGGNDSPLSTSYSTGDDGTKAVYTLLDRLGYRVDRLTVPYTEMPSDTAVLICAAPQEEIKADERAALDRWIRAGGTAIFAANSLENVPAEFGSTRKLGKGSVHAFNSIRAVSNMGAKDYRNVIPIVDAIADHAAKSRLVLFDEYHHGLGRSELQSIILHTQRQIKLGAGVLAVALLVLCYGRGRRFGAVRSLPSYENRRPEFEYVESIARLYDKAGAADLAAEILVKSLRQSLCLKLGLSSDVPRALIVQRLGNSEAGPKIDHLLAYEQAGQKMTKAELLRVAQEIHSVEKELGLVQTGS